MFFVGGLDLISPAALRDILYSIFLGYYVC